ncbi:TPR-REGION domain-containing protein [Mycena venus]|uniref:TPR-REGION domain-containing protein n=1 Tax=Mycena venus TaxID=2733690 RepID=A0A8H6YGV0_9AGAR|nr:TPR-REGION domain-containing protein [Mycena venus]
MAEELKVAGNALFTSKSYEAAARKYSEAIQLNPQSAVLYSNRAACHLALARHEDGLLDATKATKLDPTYSKGWYRKGACEDALGQLPESIESYQTAETTALTAAQRSTIQATLRSVQDKILDPSLMSIDVMKALARAHDIPLPPSTSRNVVYQALSTHPLFGSEPKLRLLLIPQSETAPLTQLELERGPDIRQKIAALLTCRLVDCVLLHSEDQIAYAREKPFGVGIGRLHTSYEAWMDDSAIADRPLNKRACQLLRRPKTYGPIAVMKTTCIKSDADLFSKSTDIVCFERVDEEELLSDHFKALRAEWVRYKGTGDAPLVIETGGSSRQSVKTVYVSL